MKVLALISCLVLVGVTTADDDVCYNSISALCRAAPSKTVSHNCNSLLENFQHSERDLVGYVDRNLASSYKYLLLGTYFDNFQMNRPGFYKLFRSMSDKTFDLAIDLIKHITKRGGNVHFNRQPHELVKPKERLEIDEIYALSVALDNEKELATEAHRIHEHASTNGKNQRRYDPEVTQFLEEKFFPHQTECIRKLAGYANDLASMMNTKDPSLSVFLFDEYLQKQ